MEELKRNIVFEINGGIGKSIAATATLSVLRKKYPKAEYQIIVLSGYPDVFINSPDVDMSFAMGGEQYFWTKYMDVPNKDTIWFGQEPYKDSEHKYKREHLNQTWCRLCGVEYNGEQPVFTVKEREIDFYKLKYHTEKPILLMQTNGGASNQEIKYSWARDIPFHVGQAIVDEFKNEYSIVHVRREDQPTYEGTITLTDNVKGLGVIIGLSAKRLFMDSCCQHLAAAMKKPSTVCWIVNSPKVFGYELHDNILANEFTAKGDLRFSIETEYNIGGALHEFPYIQEKDIFDIDKIIASIKAQK